MKASLPARARLFARKDPLAANSGFLMLNLVTMGGLGFVFWLIAAKLFSTTEIGIGTSMIAATSVISFASLMGINTTFLRFLPASRHTSEDINSGLIVVFTSALLLSSLYVTLAPAVAPTVGREIHNPAGAVVFVLCNGFAAVNIATDAIFVAFRSAKYNVVIDGVVIGVGKIVAILIFSEIASLGVFLSAMSATAIGTVVSVLVIRRRFGYRPTLHVRWEFLRQRLGFSSATYLGNLLRQIPVLVVPTLILDRLGPRSAAYFYVAYQLANLLFAIGSALEQSLMTEGSQRGIGADSLSQLARASLRIGMAVAIPGVIGVCVFRSIILGFFGPAYRTGGGDALLMLAVACPAWVVLSIISATLRVRLRLRAIVVVNSVYCFATVVCCVALVGRGIAFASSSLLAGACVACVVGGLFMVSSGKEGVRRTTPRKPLHYRVK